MGAIRTAKPKKKKPIGRPKGTGRSKEAGKSTSVRVTDRTREILTREFGSLGAALYYLAEGIEDFRDHKNLPSHLELKRLYLDDWRKRQEKKRRIKEEREELERLERIKAYEDARRQRS